MKQQLYLQWNSLILVLGMFTKINWRILSIISAFHKCYGLNLMEALSEYLEKYYLNIKFIHRQGYTGALAMSGQENDVQAYICQAKTLIVVLPAV